MPETTLSMPKGKDSTGITFDGPVLTGGKSLDQRRREETVQVAKAKLTGSNPHLDLIPNHLRPRETRKP